MSTPTDIINWTKFAAYIAAGFCMGIGALGPSIGQGYTGGKACEAIGKKPESAGLITRTMILGMTIIESSALYCLLISIILIFFTK